VPWLSRLVKLAVTVALVALVLLLIRSKMPATEVGQKFTAWALFHDGSRLALGSPVRIAGVRVGEIDQLTIEGDFARIDLKLRDDLDIPVDSWITKRAESAFGDSYLELIPSIPEPGAPTARRLRSGDQIVHVDEGSSTDTTLRTIARTMPKIDQGLDTVHDFAMDGRRWANGALKESLDNADRWLAEGNIDRPIEAADRAMEGFERGTERAANAVVGARPDFDHALDRYNKGLTNARTSIADFKKSFREGMANARDGMDRLDEPAQEYADITAAIDQGSGEDWKGTLGRLVNNPKTYDDLADITEDARDAFSSFNQLKSWLGLRGELNVFGAPRVYLTAEIRARNDKFYLIELEKGPLGSIPADQLHDVVNAQSFNRYQEIDDSVRYTLQFGKLMFGHLQLRGGIKESTFGFGADVLLNNGKLRFESDLFGSFSYTPRLKVSAALAVFRSLYILGGVDDVLNDPGSLRIVNGNSPVPQQFASLRYGRNYFVGAALHFDDADLTTIVRVYGAMLAGLIK
jgi:phospholipid/cholesterol/gamma-HCH transport system substrate-binding protein